jgi:N-acetylglutamate synthase-like GNAT family acetyltransferase
MKSNTLQDLIKKVSNDEKIKKQFMSNPESVISQYSLNEQEKKAVLNAHTKIGLATSDSGQLEAVIDPYVIWH